MTSSSPAGIPRLVDLWQPDRPTRPGRCCPGSDHHRPERELADRHACPPKNPAFQRTAMTPAAEFRQSYLRWMSAGSQVAAQHLLRSDHRMLRGEVTGLGSGMALAYRPTVADHLCKQWLPM